MDMSRREFIGTSTAAAAALTAGGRAFAANDKVGVCCIGIHGQGNTHIRSFSSNAGSEVVAICDVDRNVLDQRAAQVEKATGKRPKTYVDMREVMADPAVRAVSIATPNHWHALAAVWACQAGKDVYVEKPFAYTYSEAVAVRAAAKKHGRIVQHGTQQRSDATRIREMKLIHAGFIGDIVHARGYVYKTGNRGSIGHGHAAPPPANLDYNLWQGPAHEQPYMAKEDGSGLFVHYNWHWFWIYGNGEIGNQGVHEMDVAAWAINKGLPVRVYSTGGRWGLDDDGQTPNTHQTDFTYADGTILTFEVRNLGSFPEGGDDDCSDSAFGTKGYWVKNKGFFDYKHRPIPIPESEPLPESQGPYGNFLQAVRSRKTEDIHGSMDEAFAGVCHIHLGNIAYRLKRSLEFDPAAGRFKHDAEADRMLGRQYRAPFVMPKIA